MATPQELCQSIIEFHEKVNYDENTAIRGRVLKAVNKAINHVWSKADWTFKGRILERFEYDPETDVNTLPEDLLSFQGTGRVVLLDSNGYPKYSLKYMPFNQMLNELKSVRNSRGNPEFYSYGGPLDGSSNQRSLFLYPPPQSITRLTLIYQASAPKFTLDNWTDEIPSIPPNWHETVIEEVAILFRLMDKGADITAQTGIVTTALAAMMRDEPHGREDAHRIVPAYANRMNINHLG